MKLWDLTHTIDAATRVWPGTEPPRLRPSSALETDGFRETRLELGSHTGTHADAPAHLLPAGRTLDSLELSAFCGEAHVLDCRGLGEGGAIPPGAVEAAAGAEYLLVCTGWDRYWGTDRYFGRFPVLQPRAVERAVELGLRGIGVDTMSIDPMDSADCENHHIALRGGLVIVENLCELAPLAGRRVGFAAFPLKYRGADGAPVRAVALLRGAEPLSAPAVTAENPPGPPNGGPH